MKKLSFLALGLLLWAQASGASAFNLETMKDTPVNSDFVLGPGKVDMVLEPGEKTQRQITVTNRLGVDMDFKVEVEDFTGSYDTEETVHLLGDAKGPYSLRDYVKPEVTEFSLKHGERITLPVEISIPAGSQPGGLYASLLVSTDPGLAKANGGQQTTVISRLGALFFVRVAGEVKEAGTLQNFKVRDTQRGFYEKGPVPFEIYFENQGNIHLFPSGRIEVRNLLGNKVGDLEVTNFFAMPNSLRKAVVEWPKGFLLGRYTATVTLNPNYQQAPNQAETMTTAFWVIPWKLIVAALAVLFTGIYLIKLLAGRFKFEIKRK